LANAAKEANKITGGGVDVLIVNGGYVKNPESSYHPSQWIGKEELLKEDMTESFLVNVLGPVYTINAFLSLIRAGISKKIIVISTGMADSAFVELLQSPDALSYA
jgi:NAD(P)-dependent dehydrogenase (short-subunit alcohol dehydrogenase family)